MLIKISKTTFCFLILLVVAFDVKAELDDGRYKELLIGSWLTDFGSIVQYSADGSATQFWPNKNWTVSVKWNVKNGVVYIDVIASIHPDVSIGDKFRDLIIRIDKKELVYMDSSGTHIWKRIKTKIQNSGSDI
jgi:hypothetical protein